MMRFPRHAARGWRMAVAAVAIASPLAAQQNMPPRDLDRYVAQVMQVFEVPGIALAIVQDGKVAVANGYGVRTLGDPTPVDPYTRFGIASNTKAFSCGCNDFSRPPRLAALK